MPFDDLTLTAAPAGHVGSTDVLCASSDVRTVAALYVEPNGCYVGVPGVDPWDEARDARKYAGPHPVVCHSPCQRWGKFWHGSTRKPHQYRLGEDGGCFAAALTAVRNYGGVLEHPADSKAWKFFGLREPKRGEGWVKADDFGCMTCYVEQGHYGHESRKPTWLLAKADNLPQLNWTKGEQRLPEWMIERYGYEKARRIGVVAMIGGKDKTAKRNAMPEPFRDVLLAIARKAHNLGAHLQSGQQAEGLTDELSGERRDSPGRAKRVRGNQSFYGFCKNPGRGFDQ